MIIYIVISEQRLENNYDFFLRLTTYIIHTHIQ